MFYITLSSTTWNIEYSVNNVPKNYLRITLPVRGQNKINIFLPILF